MERKDYIGYGLIDMLAKLSRDTNGIVQIDGAGIISVVIDGISHPVNLGTITSQYDWGGSIGAFTADHGFKAEVPSLPNKPKVESTYRGPL
jgi:hypothetical protein